MNQTSGDSNNADTKTYNIIPVSSGGEDTEGRDQKNMKHRLRQEAKEQKDKRRSDHIVMKSPRLSPESIAIVVARLAQSRAFRDVFARFWQYGARCITGFHLERVWWHDLEASGSMCRKWLRFFQPIAAYKALKGLHNDKITKDTEMKMWMAGELTFSSIYCLVDHVLFFQNINLIPATKAQREWWGRFVEIWWCLEIICALKKDWKNLREEQSKEKPDLDSIRKTKLRMAKLCFDFYCALNLVFPAQSVPTDNLFRRFKDRILLGACGAIASGISLYSSWPDLSEELKSRRRRSPSRAQNVEERKNN